MALVARLIDISELQEQLATMSDIEFAVNYQDWKLIYDQQKLFPSKAHYYNRSDQLGIYFDEIERRQILHGRLL